MTATSEASNERNDKGFFLRLPGSLLNALHARAARYGAGAERPISTSEYVRAVLAAHVEQRAGPCGPLCPGG